MTPARWPKGLKELVNARGAAPRAATEPPERRIAECPHCHEQLSVAGDKAEAPNLLDTTYHARRRARRSQRTEPETEFAWLIERGQSMKQVPTVWWTGIEGWEPGDVWTTDAFAARRFPSKEVAETEIKTRTKRWGVTREVFGIAVEHGFSSAGDKAEAPPKPKRERIDWKNVVVDEGDEATW